MGEVAVCSSWLGRQQWVNLLCRDKNPRLPTCLRSPLGDERGDGEIQGFRDMFCFL